MTTPANTSDPAEIHRTHPDRVVYDPSGGTQRDWDDPEFFWLNEHVLVQETGDGNLLATWTSERLKPRQLLRIAASNSTDGGRTWTEARYVDGSGLGEGYPAGWQVPVIAPSGRVYMFYTYGHSESGNFFGGFRCRTSDNHGHTWSPATDLNFPKGRFDNPDADVEAAWICCAGPHTGPKGEVLIPYTLWATNSQVPGADVGITQRYSHIEVMRIDNLADEPSPRDLHVTWLNSAAPVTAAHATIEGSSFAQEPYLANPPDGRLLMTLRTNRGEAWYTVSADGGQSWCPAEPMRYRDGGVILKQPASPCPVFALDRGDFLFLFNNNDGYVFGAESVWDARNRRPAYLCRGEFRADAHQPIWWSEPELLIDNDAAPLGPPDQGRLEAAAYASLTEYRDERILWYPDRKGFLLGKVIDSQRLDAMVVPR